MYDNNINQFIIDGYNYGTQVELNNFRDFVAFHYKMSSRNDTPYWKFQTEGRNFIGLQDENKGFVPYHRPDGMALNEYERLLYHDNIGHNWPLTPGQGDGIYYLMAGMGFMPFGKIFFDRYILSQSENREEATKKLEALHDEWKTDIENTIKYVKTLPSSHQFLQEHIYGFDN